eukprot:403350737
MFSILIIGSLHYQAQAVVYNQVTNCVQCMYNTSSASGLIIPNIRWCNASTPERSTCSDTACPAGNVTINNVMRCPYNIEDVDINDGMTGYPILRINTYQPRDQLKIYRVNNTMVKNGIFGSYWINDNFNNMTFFLSKADPAVAQFKDLKSIQQGAVNKQYINQIDYDYYYVFNPTNYFQTYVFSYQSAIYMKLSLLNTILIIAFSTALLQTMSY